MTPLPANSPKGQSPGGLLKPGVRRPSSTLVPRLDCPNLDPGV